MGVDLSGLWCDRFRNGEADAVIKIRSDIVAEENENEKEKG